MSGGGDRNHEIGDALRRASAHGEAGVERIEGSVGAMLTEVERRRRAASAPSSVISASARAWLPGLTLATVALALAALFWPMRTDAPQHREGASDAHSLERWLVTGAAPSSVADPVLDALMR